MQPSLFDAVGFYAPAQARKPAEILENATVPHTTPTQTAAPKKPPSVTAFAKGDPVTLGGREYRVHRAGRGHVWLAGPDTGVAGPYYLHRVEDLLDALAPADRVRAARRRLAACETDGPQYMAALGELRAAMEEGARG